MSSSGDWLLRWLQALDQGQRGLLQALHALGLVGEQDGQPAWPWASRLAIELLAIDRALARSLLLTVAVALLAMLLLLLGLAWRRGRRPVWTAAALAALLVFTLAPWGERSLLLADAVPTSFQSSPHAFSAAAIVQGESLYRQHCVACHGSEGSGDGPRAASLAMWPPDLNSGLLGRRREGELLRRVLQGLKDKQQRQTMPAFAGTLSTAQAWQVLDYLQAQAAGQALRERGVWAQPVALPDLPVHCDGGPPRPLRSWTGQRPRLVAADAATALREDPRFVTIALRAPGDSRPAAGCEATGADAWIAFARIAGVAPEALAGTQFIADREGWLRARSAPGQAGWRADDLVCRADDATKAAPMPGDALDGLIARMDQEPVRFVRAGVPH
ncbi:c-type cytochrome [Ideonella azotifigens]|uniref:Cytochrome c domain-containing protein n=1 Tax=Ideonella azotifigens TaxID=513160 RepID=A0ABP3VVC3_9BURK|nr:c-type cytochrome [Ideonella azotifigens]MCD2343349.1 c-type cytochrome [Ideonella azotifigens]